MKNRIITSLCLVAVLCISIGFAIYNLPMPEYQLVSYRDSFEHHTNTSDIYTSEAKNVIISTENFVETHTSSEENANFSISNNTNTSNNTNNTAVSGLSDSPSPSSQISYSSFFDDEDDNLFDEDDFQKEVYVSVEGIDETLAEGYISFDSGDTVFDVTKSLLDKNNVELKRRGSGATLYIYKIGDLEEKDHGPLSGWTYKVNGEKVNLGCGSYKVDIGDVIDWVYQTN